MGYVKKDFCTALALAFGIEGAERVERQPIAYSYNGVILPKLPEWDRERYPYAWMTNAKRNLVYFTDKPMMRCTGANGGEVFAINGNNHAGQEVSVVMYQISADGTKFEMAMKYDNTDALLLVTQNAPLWTNYDVIDVDDGSVCFAASDPIPVYKFFGYSYNGTILPQLPAWDKETYPYAVLQDNGNYHRLTVSSKPPYAKILSNTVYISVDSDAIGSTWELYTGDVEWSDGWNTASVLAAKPILWANYDVKYEDGTDYLSASEPIPVYE